ncbi:nucleoside deaminase [Clostridium sporogenes]|uniref:tRNA-specific adenosine deaminase n=1 Tax=Clostridium sporogenes TaxID=1509 RepID=A0A7U5D213_CLOSG|nr:MULTISPECIES: nucleoside deaminase [Clostridium]AKC60790.1 tRNA-specific adenosine deaminase TadA [Clostridium sporogenes]AKJ88154.1 adenosine deaminase [Clostridium sporogenes]KCZ66548.1 tRNA-specific adenosine deaminase TadA [Clostridium sporogenes]MBE6055542.1 nucleoside deaminase [Clostridium sp.]NFH49106.1 nucleoside deaminase [Clostridium sporogenes]
MDSYIEYAIIEAKKALAIGEVPVGAVIVKENKIIAKSHNLKEALKDPTAHAEVLAIKKACKILENWRLKGCKMYVTLEPCAMCASAIIQSRISELHIGTFDPVGGACGSVINITNNSYLKSNLSIEWLYDDECSKIITNFFENIRKNI